MTIQFDLDEFCVETDLEVYAITAAEVFYRANKPNILNTRDQAEALLLELDIAGQVPNGIQNLNAFVTAVGALEAALKYYNGLEAIQEDSQGLTSSITQMNGLVNGISNSFGLASAAISLIAVFVGGPAAVPILIASQGLTAAAVTISTIAEGLDHTINELSSVFPDALIGLDEAHNCVDEEIFNPEEGVPDDSGPLNPGGIRVFGSFGDKDAKKKATGILQPDDPNEGDGDGDSSGGPDEPDGGGSNDGEEPEGEPVSWWGHVKSWFDPLVLDLDGDGAELTEIGNPEVFFDFEGNSIQQMTGWIDPDDGILVRDLDNNGRIETTSELFGNATTDAFTDLATQDSNADGVINQADAIWRDLRVWRDLNQDGVTDDGELISATDAGVLSVSLDRESVRQERAGNQVVAEGTYTTNTGEEREAIAVFLETSSTQTRAVLPDGFQFDPAVFKLPDIAGTGELFNLHVAMSMDPELLAEAQAFAAAAPSMSGAGIRDGIESLLSSWSGNSRSDYATDGDFDLAISQAVLGNGAPIAQLPTVQTAVYESIVDAMVFNFLSQLGLLAVANAQTPEESSAALEHPFFGLSSISIDNESASFEGSLASALNMASSILTGEDRNLAIDQIEKIFPSLHAFQAAEFNETYERVGDESEFEANVWAILETTISDNFLKAVAQNYVVASTVETGTDGDDTISVFHDDYTQEYNRDISVVKGGAGDDTITHANETELFAHLRDANTSVTSYIYKTGDGNDTLDLAGAQHMVHAIYLTDIALEEAVIRAGTDGQSAQIALPDGGSITILGITNDAVQIQFIFEDGRFQDTGDIVATGGIENNVIDGTSDDDTFDGGSGDDVISGAGGSDTYHFFSGGGHDEINEQVNIDGVDLLWMRDANLEDVTVTFVGNGDVTLATQEGDTVTLKGQFAPAFSFSPDMAPRIEMLRFADGREISAADLQDIVFRQLATGGSDTITGTKIGERLFLSAGNDTITGGRGADEYVRDASVSGNDQINDLGGSSGDRLVVEGFTRDAVTFVRDGNDVRIDFADGSSTVLIGQMATNGISTIEEIEFSDGEIMSAIDIAIQVNAESGADNDVTGSNASETLTGGISDDTLDGLSGDDLLEGMAGSDLYIRRSGDGDDTIFDLGGGSHSQTDRIVFEDQSVDGVAFRRTQSGDLEIQTRSTGEVLTVRGQFSGSLQVGIEEFVFADGERLSAAEIVELAPISGTDGDDVLAGLGGNDVLVGGLGDDEMDGGTGADIYVIRAGDGEDIIDDVISGDDINTLRLIGIDPADISVERVTNDVHNDALIRISDTQTVLLEGQFSPIDDSRGIQRIVFDDGSEMNREALKSIAEVVGTGASENLLGSVEDDIITAGAGDDTVSGLSGDDVYNWGAGDGNDIILDNAAANDQTIDTIVFAGLNQTDVSIERSANDDLEVTLSSGETLTVRDQFRGQLSGSVNGVGALAFADGSTLTRSELVEMFPIEGTDIDENLTGSLGDDALRAGLGDDRVDGSRGNDIVLWRKGDGNDIVFDTGVEATERDVLKFVDVESTEVSFARGGFFYNDLDIIIAETGERVSISNHFNNGVGSNSGVEQIIFADGVTIDTADITNAPYIGTDAEGYIEAGDQDDILIGGGGMDDLFGGAGADTYVHQNGDGNDTINETYEQDSGFDDSGIPTEEEITILAHNSAGDILDLTGRNQSDVTFARSADNPDDLIVSIAADGEEITIVSQFTGPLSGVESFVFDDGMLSSVDVAQMVAPRETVGTDEADELTGEFLDETFLPGTGDDRIVTGGGQDTIIIESGSGTDEINGFVGGAFGTIFEFVPAVFTDYDAVVQAASQVDNNVEIEFDGNSLILTNIQLSDLSPENFGFEPAPIAGTASGDALLGTLAVDHIDAGGGNDIIDARAGNDTVDAGAGNDVIRHEQGDGNDAYDGGEGHDTLELSGGAATVNFASGFVQTGDETLSFSDIESVVLGAGNDVVVGNDEDNSIRLGNGTNEARGAGGDDAIVGGEGADKAAFSGNRSDYSVREDGTIVLVEDRRDGSPDGLDRLFGIEELVFADGSYSIEDLLAEPALPEINGSESNDSLVGTAVAEYISGRSGDDRIVGKDGNDIVDGGDGHDTLLGGNDNDQLQGGFGDDVLRGGRGADSLTGGDGDDRLIGGADNDELTGGEGADSLSGGSGADVLKGGTDNDVLRGGAGADILHGEGDDDHLSGGENDDILDGGDGIDYLRGGAGNDILDGGNDGDIINGGSGADSLTGGSGDDRLIGSAGDDELIGGEGADRLSGGSGNDVILGGLGNDRAYGGSGDDMVEGGQGQDILRGGAGSDSLSGGVDEDNLWGGAGSDVFVFSAGDGTGRDVIRDFELGVDMIGLSGLAVADIVDTGNHALVTFDNGGEALIRGINASELDLGDDFAYF